MFFGQTMFVKIFFVIGFDVTIIANKFIEAGGDKFGHFVLYKYRTEKSPKFFP